MTGPYLTQREMAEMLKVSPETIRKWRYEGKFQSVRIAYKTIRIPVSEVNRLIEESKK
jgi:excisionase family DNA binding protein